MKQTTRNLKTIFESLELVPAESGSQGWERRRIPRLHLHREQFREATHQIVYPVENISERGMSLRPLRDEDQEFFLVGRKVAGILNFAGEKIDLKATVAHATRNWVGLQFEGLSSKATHSLQSLLDPKFLGSGLKPVPSLDTDLSWYHGHSGTDLVLAHPGGKVVEGFLIVYGAYISWASGEKKHVTTGLLHPVRQSSEESFGLIGFETVALKADSQPDFQKLEVAKQIISSSNLPKEHKKRCVKALGEAQGGS